MNNEPYILIIGAAHIDVFANYDRSLSSRIDKPGRINFSLGGTGFNIAANLAFDQKNTYFITAINPKTLSGLCVAASLKARRINSKFIVDNTNLSEGAFVALIQDGDLVSAVTQTPIEELNFEDDKLVDAISNASVVVADCNLNGFQLIQVIQQCYKYRKPILVAGVSESKAERIKLCLEQHFEIDVFSLNYQEAIHLLSGYKDIYDYFACNNEDISIIEDWSNPTIQEVCSRLQIKYLIVTKGQDGYLVLSKAGNLYSFPAIKLDGKFVSSSGAGDALLAGVASYYKTYNTNPGWEPDWKKCNKIIQRYVNHVLSIQQACPCNLADGDLPLIYVEQVLSRNKESHNSKGYQVYLFSFLVVLAISSIILAFLDKLTFPIVALLSIIIFSTLLIYKLLSEEGFLKLIPNIYSKNNSSKE